MKAFALISLVVLAASITSAQGSHPTVYVESKDEFANDFSAGVIRKNVAVALTGDLQQAGYVARFTWATNEGSKTQGVMTALMTGVYISGAYERVSMSIVERKSKDLVYSYTCQKGGRHVQSVAECLAKHWKDALDSGKIKMREFTPADLEGIHDGDGDAVSIRKSGDTLPALTVVHPEPKADTQSMMVVSANGGTEPLNATSVQAAEAAAQPESLGDAARRYREQKAAAQQSQ
jgi:hypothetical protein